MKRHLFYTLILGIFSIASCYDEKQVIPDFQLSIPNDTLAFYLIEGYQESIDFEKISIDSIKEFKNRIIGYNEIISYDTSNYIFELTKSGRENIDSLLFARYARRYPLAAMSEGKILFCVYLNNPALSSIPNWYCLEPYYSYLFFCLPPFTDETIEPDLRIEPRMLQVLESGNKLK